MIGFNFPRKYKWQHGYDYPEPVPQKTCPIHPGVPVVQMKGEDPELLFCCQCGTPYKEEDTITKENFNPESGPANKTFIVTGKKKKKYYDKQGNQITDPDLIADVKRGSTVISYREQKQGEENQIVKV
jgi:hypothetical protein